MFSGAEVPRYCTISRGDTRVSVAALELNARMGGKPWVAHTQCDYARMLLARNLPGDGEKARGLLHDALTAAQELGMKAIEEKARQISAQVHVDDMA